MTCARADITPPSSREAVEAVAAALRADERVRQGLGANSAEEAEARVMPHRQRLRMGMEGAPLDSLPERFLVVRELAVAGGRRRAPSLISMPGIQVMTECSEDLPNLYLWHDRMHRTAIRPALLKASLELGEGQLAACLYDESEASPPMRDADTETFYSTALYRLALAPRISPATS